jgi:choline kinase
MKAVILAAGRGTRIRSVHGEHPKCLITVDDTTILDHQLEALSMAGINEVAIVLAINWLRGDSFIVLNADVIFDSGILNSAVQLYAPISMIVDPLWRDETMKVIIEDDRVTRMSKRISQEVFSGTYIGITVFSESIQSRFLRKLSDLIAAGRVNEFFNIAVQELADEGVHVGYTSTGGLAWAEIDDPLDLTFAQQSVFPNLAARIA